MPRPTTPTPSPSPSGGCSCPSCRRRQAIAQRLSADLALYASWGCPVTPRQVAAHVVTVDHLYGTHPCCHPATLRR